MVTSYLFPPLGSMSLPNKLFANKTWKEKISKEREEGDRT